jgi:DNA mismatch repair protein MutS2
VRAEDLRPGVVVHVPRLRSDAEVLDPPTRGRVRVAAGAMKLWVDVDEVRASAAAPVGRSEPRGAPARAEDDAPRDDRNAPPPTELTTLDVRGMRVDDALAMIETFIDRLYGGGHTAGWILHGHGTGALRDAVRKQLASASRYIRSVRAATPEEGGDRYTIAFIR